MTLLQKTLRIVDMLEHMECLDAIEWAYCKWNIFYCREKEIFCREYFTNIKDSFLIEIYTIYIPSSIVIWDELESMIASDIEDFLMIWYQCSRESRSEHLGIWYDIDVFILASHLIEAWYVSQISHMTCRALYIIALELSISFTTIIVMKDKSRVSWIAEWAWT